MDAAFFVEQLGAANQEILSRLAPVETLVAESGGDLRLENLLKIALKNELEATEIAARWLVSTSDIDVKLALARQAGDEAKHYRLIEAHLQGLGADLSGFDPLAQAGRLETREVAPCYDCGHDAEVVDDEPHPDRKLVELLAHAERGELLGIAPDQDESGEVPAVRLEEDRLEALNDALLLQAGVVAEGLAEELRRLGLASANDLAPPDEETGVGHVHLQCVADVTSMTRRGVAGNLSSATRVSVRGMRSVCRAHSLARDLRRPG